MTWCEENLHTIKLNKINSKISFEKKGVNMKKKKMLQKCISIKLKKSIDWQLSE